MASTYNYYWDQNDPSLPFTVSSIANAISLVPDNATRVEPPRFQKGTIPCWSGKEWVVKVDWRLEKLWDKRTGKQTGYPFVEIDPDDFEENYTVFPPSTEFDKWVDDGWVTDQAALTASKVAKLNDRRKTLIAEAAEQISLIGDIVLFKEDIEDEDLPQYKQLLKNWRVYRGGLLTMKITTGDEKFSAKPKTLDEFMG